jgi:oxalate decarboxylase
MVDVLPAAPAFDWARFSPGNPADVLATNFGKPASLFQKFPKKDVFITDKNGSK